jgi:molecular chaperone GrpE
MTQDNTNAENQDTNNPTDGGADEVIKLDPFKARDQRIAELEAQVGQLQHKILLAAAEYQNVIRRSQNNIGEAREQNTIDIARALLKGLDLFDMALACDPKKVNAESILMGVQMVQQEMVKSLESFGIKRVDAKPGDEFNPLVHEAVSHVSVPGIAAGKVAAQLQSGYKLGDKTLRPARVNIAE